MSPLENTNIFTVMVNVFASRTVWLKGEEGSSREGSLTIVLRWETAPRWHWSERLCIQLTWLTNKQAKLSSKEFCNITNITRDYNVQTLLVTKQYLGNKKRKQKWRQKCGFKETKWNKNGKSRRKTKIKQLKRSGKQERNGNIERSSWTETW